MALCKRNKDRLGRERSIRRQKRLVTARKIEANGILHSVLLMVLLVASFCLMVLISIPFEGLPHTEKVVTAFGVLFLILAGIDVLYFGKSIVDAVFGKEGGEED